MEAIDTLREKGVKRIGPYRVTRTMGSTVSACLATPFQIKGVNYSISSACATSAHCIGQAMEQIQLGKRDVVFAGGGEEEHWSQSCLFDAMGALSTSTTRRRKRPPAPTTPSVTASSSPAAAAWWWSRAGACAQARRQDLRRDRRLRRHLRRLRHGRPERRRRDPLHAAGAGHRRRADRLPEHHGTSTPVGDVAEIRGVREVFGDKAPAISSTKSLSGHSLGAAGVHEAIYCLLMMEGGFIAGSANIDELDPKWPTCRFSARPARTPSSIPS